MVKSSIYISFLSKLIRTTPILINDLLIYQTEVACVIQLYTINLLVPQTLDSVQGAMIYSKGKGSVFSPNYTKRQVIALCHLKWNIYTGYCFN